MTLWAVFCRLLVMLMRTLTGGLTEVEMYNSST